jgi:hypothetical protein
MRLAAILTLLATALWAQAEERTDGSYLVQFTPGDSRIELSVAGESQGHIDVTAGPDAPFVHISDVSTRHGTVLAAGSSSTTNAGFTLISYKGEIGGWVETWPLIPVKAALMPRSQGVVLYGSDPPTILVYSGEEPKRVELPEDSPAVPTLFTATGSRIVIWSQENSQWREYKLDGTLVAQIEIPPPPGLDSRVVFTESLDIFGGSGEALYQFDRKENIWKPVSELLREPFPGTLLGAEGPRLFFRTDGGKVVRRAH